MLKNWHHLKKSEVWAKISMILKKTLQNGNFTSALVCNISKKDIWYKNENTLTSCINSSRTLHYGIKRNCHKRYFRIFQVTSHVCENTADFRGSIILFLPLSLPPSISSHNFLLITNNELHITFYS
jgi:hypothetical protein